MPPADILAFVENFITTVTAFAYSCLFSLWILFSRPKIAPRFLKRKLKSKDSKQVGPMTLIFLGVSILFFLYFELAQQFSGETNKSVFNPENRKTSTELLAACFLVTIIVDGLARFFTLLLWSKPKIRGYLYRAARFHDKRVEISYGLVTSVFVFAVTTLSLVIIVFLANIDIISKYSDQHRMICVVMYCVFCYVVIRFLVHSSVVAPCLRARNHGMGRLVIIEIAIPFSIATTVYLSTKSLGIVSFMLPDVKDVYVRADSEDILASNFTCSNRKDSDLITISADFFNKNKSSFGILYGNFGINISYEAKPVEKKDFSNRIEVDPKASRFIGPGSLTRYYQSFHLGNAYKIDPYTDCAVEWSLTKPSWLFSHQDPFYGVGSVSIGN